MKPAITVVRAAFRILLKGGGGGQNSCFHIPVGVGASATCRTLQYI